MKKLTALAIALTMLLSFTACNSEGGGSAEADVVTTAKAETVKDETTNAKSEETTAPNETTTEETTTEPVVEANPVEDFEFEEYVDGEITITKYKGSEAEVIIPAEIDGKPVTTIGGGAFQGSSITSVVVPEGVKTIGYGAFCHCSKLEDISLPESIVNIDIGEYGQYYSSGRDVESPFTGTSWLENKRAENPLIIVNNIVVDGKTCSRDVEIPEEVRVIAGGAFNGCTTITSVKLPDSLETVGDYAFTKCGRLTEIILPDSVNYIGDEAFKGCSALENVMFPNNTVEMGEAVFGNIIGGINKEEYFTPWLEKKVSENPLVIVNGNLINGQKCTGDVVIPDSVKSIAQGAFSGAVDNKSGIESVQLPNGITKIPYSLFSGCNLLTSVTIPDSVTEIGSWAFAFTTLESITIPSSVKEIGDYAFHGTKLKSITIQNGVTKIGNYAFAGDNEWWCCTFESITIPGSVTEIGDEAFSKCKNLKSVTLSEGLKKIGSNAFTYTNITELTLPDSLESIATDAFYGCKFDITYKGEIYFPELYDELYAAINGN